MLEVYSKGVLVPAGSAIPLNTVVIGGRGCSDERLVGASTIQFIKAGVYPVHVTASAVASVAGEISIQLFKDGVAQPQAVQQVTAANTTGYNALNFSTLVHVGESAGKCQCSMPTGITIVNTSENPVTFDLDVMIP